MWKKKADKPITNSMAFNLSCKIEVDSSLSDEELSKYMTGAVREMFTNDTSRIIVKRVTRDGEGVIQSISVDVVV